MRPEKGTYRSIYSSIWDDPEFQSFDPITQLVFLCLRTWRDCNFPAIYVMYRSQVYERMPNVPAIAIDAAIDALASSGWIRYERPVLWIVKGLKNEPAFSLNNQKQVIGISKIIHSLPSLQIVKDFASMYGIPYRKNSPTHSPHHSPTDSPPIPLPKQGKGKGEGKGKEDLATVASRQHSDKDNGTGGVARSPEDRTPPVPVGGNFAEQLRKAQAELMRKRRELGIPDAPKMMSDNDKFLRGTDEEL